MKTDKNILLLLVILTSTMVSVKAKENIGSSGLRKKQVENVLSGCTSGITQDVMQLNNVRTTILTDGDMWWNLVSAKYEVPKGQGASSIFAGSLWIGGLDNGGQLKIAAMTYRQNGVDYWPGPIDTTGGGLTTSPTACQYYDKHWILNRNDVENYVSGNVSAVSSAGLIMINNNWPGNALMGSGEASSVPIPGTNGVPGSYLAPFYDANGNGSYDPSPGGGDYPLFSLSSHPLSCGVTQLFGDQTMWGVFNDEGNIHTETNGQPIGLEVRYQCFAFSTGDANNNATFYDYQVINRANITLGKTYFGVWCDFDLGFYDDDFTGCDVTNGIGYGYNGTAVDGNGQAGTYGANPPCVGIDFFRGPKADPNSPTDGIDQSGVSFVNPLTGRIGMAKFVYYNNDFTVQGNPTTAQSYYNYLSGFWIDGTPFTYGGNAYKGSGPVCDFMFPGSSDPTGKGTKNVPQQAWAEYPTPANPSGDVPGDRRFMESAGPFTLQPGAVNSVTTGVIWAKTTNGGNLASISLMQDADVLAQALFNACFQITNGPDAPNVTVTELSNQLIFYLTNSSTSNNYKEHYSERDPYMSLNLKDSLYRFQGYQVFQIADSSVSEANLGDPSLARLVFVCGLKNSITQIINWYNNTSLAPTWVPTLEVSSPDSGITHSFVVNTDLFSTGASNTLVNNKQYYYLAIAYGYNPGEAYGDPNNTSSSVSADGFKGKDGYNIPYIASRRNVRAVVGIPHNPAPESGGTSLNSTYGNGIQLTRVEGQGNGGQILQLTPQSVTGILASGVYNSKAPDGPGGRLLNVSYSPGNTPIKIMVIDPLTIPAGNFEIAVSDSSAGARWVITNTTTGVRIKSDTTVQVGNQQIIPELGISVTVSHTTDIVSLISLVEANPSGVLYSSMVFTDPTQQWLTGVADADSYTSQPLGDQNWIRSGKFTGSATDGQIPFGDYVNYDNAQYFEKIIGGTWAPYEMCAYTDASEVCIGGPAKSVGEPPTSSTSFALNPSVTTMGKTLASVDVVITSVKANWTRCPVIEMQENKSLAEGHAAKLSLRSSQSVDQYGNYATGTGPASTNPSDPAYISRTGMGWFPGYAINVETGERLNMAFGEDSGLPTENGRDMIWNPTADTWDPNYTYPIFGGKHYIYVFAHVADQTFPSTDTHLPNGPKNMPRYDAGLTAWQLLNADIQSSTANYSRFLWGDAMWVNIPLLAKGEALSPVSNPYAFIKTDVKVAIRVPRIYRRGFSGFNGAKSATDAKVIDTVLLPNKPQNNNWPLYSFTTAGLQVATNQIGIAKNALDLINIVPNPYYAYSAYETGQLDNRVRITNIPPTCTIRIFTISGTLVYTFHKADPSTYVDWTLVNQAGIPISGGLYLIDINAPGVGEKILKWFGVLRPVDLSTF